MMSREPLTSSEPELQLDFLKRDEFKLAAQEEKDDFVSQFKSTLNEIQETITDVSIIYPRRGNKINHHAKLLANLLILIVVGWKSGSQGMEDHMKTWMTQITAANRKNGDQRDMLSSREHIPFGVIHKRLARISKKKNWIATGSPLWKVLSQNFDQDSPFFFKLVWKEILKYLEQKAAAIQTVHKIGTLAVFAHQPLAGLQSDQQQSSFQTNKEANTTTGRNLQYAVYDNRSDLGASTSSFVSQVPAVFKQGSEGSTLDSSAQSSRTQVGVMAHGQQQQQLFLPGQLSGALVDSQRYSSSPVDSSLALENRTIPQLLSSQGFAQTPSSLSQSLSGPSYPVSFLNSSTGATVNVLNLGQNFQTQNQLGMSSTNQQQQSQSQQQNQGQKNLFQQQQAVSSTGSYQGSAVNTTLGNSVQWVTLPDSASPSVSSVLLRINCLYSSTASAFEHRNQSSGTESADAENALIRGLEEEKACNWHIAAKHYDDALRLCRSSPSLINTTLHSRTLLCKSVNAMSIGGFDEARILCKELLQMRRELLSIGQTSNTDLVFALNMLSKIYHYFGHPAEALALATEAAGRLPSEVSETSLFEQSCLGLTLFSLGVSFCDRAEYQPALENLCQAIKIQSGALGPDHIDTLSSLMAITECLMDLGQTNKALEVLNHVRNLMENTPNRKNALFAECLLKIATAYGLQNDGLQCYNFANQSASHFTALYGEEHAHVTEAVLKQIDGSFLCGNPLSLDQYRLNISNLEKYYGTYHRKIANSYLELGMAALQGDGSFNEAAEILEKGFRVAEKSYPLLHPRISVVQGRLGELYLKTGDLEKADKHFLAIKNRVEDWVVKSPVGEARSRPGMMISYENIQLLVQEFQHFLKFQSMESVAKMSFLCSRFDEALTQGMALLEFIKAIWPTRNDLLFQVSQLVANTLFHLGDLKGSMSHFQVAYSAIADDDTVDFGQLGSLQLSIGYLYKLTDNWIKASDMLDKAIANFKREVERIFPDSFRLLSRIEDLFEKRQDVDSVLESLQANTKIQAEVPQLTLTCQLLRQLAESSVLKGNLSDAQNMLICRLFLESLVNPLPAPEHRATTLIELGNVLHQRGFIDQAKTLLFAAQRVLERADRRPTAQAANLEHQLGHLMSHQGDFARAYSHFQHALNTRRTLFNEKHFSIALTLYEIAVLQIALGDFKSADENLKVVLQKKFQLFGKMTPVVNMTLYQMANLKFEQGSLQSSLDSFQELRERINPHAEPGLHASTSYMIARIYHRLGTVQPALPLLEDALQKKIKLCGKRNVDVAIVMLLTGKVQLALSEFQKAFDTLNECRAIFMETVGNECLWVGQTNLCIAQVHHMSDLSLDSVAISLLQQALGIFKKSKEGCNSVEIIQTLSLLGDLSIDNGMEDEGLVHYHEAIKLLEATHKNEEWSEWIKELKGKADRLAPNMDNTSQ